MQNIFDLQRIKWIGICFQELKLSCKPMYPRRIANNCSLKTISMLLAVMLIGCGNKAAQPKPHISRAQSFLINLKDSLKTEYSKAKTDSAKKAVLEDCRAVLDGWLRNHALDSITVSIDEISVSGWTIETSCHNAFIQFQYQLTYTDRDHSDGPLVPKMDSLFQFTKALKRGNRMMLNFDYTGACLVNDPFAKGVYPFRIFAFPIPFKR